MRAAEDLIGRPVQCPRCGKVFDAPVPPAPQRDPLPEPMEAETVLFDPEIDYPQSSRRPPPARRGEWHDRDEGDDRWARRGRSDQDDRDRGFHRPRRQAEKNTLSATGMILGIVAIPMHCACRGVGLVLSIPLGITAIVLGILGYRREQAQGMATAAIVLGGVSLVLDAVVIVVLVILLTSFGPAGLFGPTAGPGTLSGPSAGPQPATDFKLKPQQPPGPQPGPPPGAQPGIRPGRRP